MSLFDTLIDYGLICPYCMYKGERISVQTKDLECEMRTYDAHNSDTCLCFWDPPAPEILTIGRKRHATFPANLRYVSGLAECHSPLCRAIARMTQIAKAGYISGVGTVFDVKYREKDGFIGGAGEITSRDYPTFENAQKAFLKMINAIKAGDPDVPKTVNKWLLPRYLQMLDWANNDIGIAVLML